MSGLDARFFYERFQLLAGNLPRTDVQQIIQAWNQALEEVFEWRDRMRVRALDLDLIAAIVQRLEVIIFQRAACANAGIGPDAGIPGDDNDLHVRAARYDVRRRHVAAIRANGQLAMLDALGRLEAGGAPPPPAASPQEDEVRQAALPAFHTLTAPHREALVTAIRDRGPLPALEAFKKLDPGEQKGFLNALRPGRDLAAALNAIHKLNAAERSALAAGGRTGVLEAFHTLAPSVRDRLVAALRSGGPEAALHALGKPDDDAGIVSLRNALRSAASALALDPFTELNGDEKALLIAALRQGARSAVWAACEQLTGVEQEQLAAALRKLFDFAPGPVSFQGHDLAERPGAVYTDTTKWKPDGLDIDQKIFLDSTGQFVEVTLDEFARDIAYDRALDGVHILAGDRGSGKSTALNRIEWYCNNWLENRVRAQGRSIGGPRPLLVRFDLNVSFDPKPFTIDLLREICRATHLHAISRPVARKGPFNWLRRAVGHVGHWAYSNRAWAVLILVVAAIFSAVAHLEDVKLLDKNLSAFARAGAILVLSVLVVGICYWVAQHVAIKFPRFAKNVPPYLMLVVFVFPLMAGLSFFDLPMPAPFKAVRAPTSQLVTVPRGQSATATTTRRVTDGEGIVYLWFGFLATLLIAIFLLPTWWWTYYHTHALAAALRVKEDKRESGFDLPLFSAISSMVRALLPQQAGLQEIRDMNLSFMLQDMKRLLKRLATDFTGVVILIDDVDVLASKCFPELFQVLRPISKVTNVRCVVCVPRHFHDAMKIDLLSDLHSTVRQSWLVGDRMLQSAIDNGAWQPINGEEEEWHAAADKLRGFLDGVVIAIVGSRCRLGPATAAPVRSLIDLMCHRWQVTNGNAARVARVLRSIGASRREIMRESDRLLGNPTAVPFDNRSDEADREASADFIANRDHYCKGERVLFCPDALSSKPARKPPSATAPPPDH